VLLGALDVLESAKGPGTVVHSEEVWPVPQTEALKNWQPKEPSPLIKMMSRRFLELARKQRDRRKAVSDSEDTAA
jgi:hypothetical protein